MDIDLVFAGEKRGSVSDGTHYLAYCKNATYLVYIKGIENTYIERCMGGLIVGRPGRWK